MDVKKSYGLRVVLVGLPVLVLVSVALFAARKVCEVIFYEAEGLRDAVARIEPSGLVPEVDKDEQTTEHSYVEARLSDSAPYGSLGLIREFSGLSDGYSGTGGQWVSHKVCSPSYARRVSRPRLFWEEIYYDEVLGQFVQVRMRRHEDTSRPRWTKEILAYAGPSGVAQAGEDFKKLGRFQGPLLRAGHVGSGFVIYDQGLSRFFRIDWRQEKVSKGAKVDEKSGHKPVQVGPRLHNKTVERTPRLRWQGPYKEIRTENGTVQRVRLGKSMGLWEGPNIMLVLDATGRVDWLDTESLEFVGPAGYLLRQQGRCTTSDVLAYRAVPFTVEGQAKGLVVATVDPSLFVVSLGVFDEKGGLKKVKHKGIAVANLPGGVAYMVWRYGLENLQAPLSLLGTYFSAGAIEPAAGRRGLFLLGNSLMAMFARDPGESIILKFLAAVFVIMLPAWLLGIVLAWRVAKDASRLGLPKRVWLCWVAGTIGFGLCAYITYRLTRPTEVLVTCVNCGKTRRPDMDRCHNCQSAWQVPELAPPSWRVVD